MSGTISNIRNRPRLLDDTPPKYGISDTTSKPLKDNSLSGIRRSNIVGKPMRIPSGKAMHTACDSEPLDLIRAEVPQTRNRLDSFKLVLPPIPADGNGKSPDIARDSDSAQRPVTAKPGGLARKSRELDYIHPSLEKNIQSSLTKEEKKSIHAYTATDFVWDIQAKLRNGKQLNINEEKTLTDLMSALKKMNKDQPYPGVVLRGINRKPNVSQEDFVNGLKQKYIPGSIHKEPGLISTTKIAQNAVNFAGGRPGVDNPDNDNALFVIIPSKENGLYADVTSQSGWQSEKEVLFAPNQSFKTLLFYENNGQEMKLKGTGYEVKKGEILKTYGRPQDSRNAHIKYVVVLEAVSDEAKKQDPVVIRPKTAC